MFYVLQNESTAALRRVPILLTDAATGTTAQTGLASTQIFPYVNINGGSFAGGAGTIAEAGYGQYYYEFDPTEVATLGLAGIHITAVGCRDYDAICQVAAFNVYSGAGAGITAGDVWSYDISGIATAGSAGTQLNLAAAGGGSTTGDVATAVWNYSGLTNAGTTKETLEFAATDSSTAASNTSAYTLRSAIWDFDVSTSGFTNVPPYASGYLINAGDGATTAGSQVWSYVLADTNTAETDLVNAASGGAGITAGDVWNYTLLSSGQSADATLGNVDTNVTTIQGNVSNIPGDVWSYVTRTLTSGSGITAGDVWSYGTRTLTSGSGITAGDVSNAVWGIQTSAYTTNGTYGKLVLRSDQASKAGDVSLASSGGVNRVDADIHAIVNDATAAASLKNALTGIGASWTGNITGNVTGSVASVTNPVSVSTTSMSGIANTVWTSGTKTITGGTVDNVTNPVAVSTTSMSGIAGTVWTNGTRTITGGIADTVSTVTGPVSVSTTSMTGIAGTVWTYTPRTITSGGGATAGDIWTYQIDTITTSGTAAAQLNDAAVSGSVVTIVNGPYRVTSTAEGSDGVIDILADSIQPITIYCINGFGQPFNIAGYTASVDIYDEAGGFVRSYTPTIDYALGGILTFNIDADVTAVIGRYTLVVSLTDGDVIQLGPLTILVRPL